MKKRTLRVLALTAAMTVISTGCSSNNGGSGGEMQHNNNQTTYKKMTIDLSTNPTAPVSGQEVQLMAHITRENQPVTDAKVEMEFWRDGDTTEHTKLPAQGGKDGNYTLTHKLTEAGKYKVIIHTTAGGIHQMPTKEFSVQSK